MRKAHISSRTGQLEQALQDACKLRPTRPWLAWITTASLMVTTVSVVGILGTANAATAAPRGAAPRPLAMGRANYLSTGAPRHASLPTSGPPPFPGEGPDLPRWNRRPNHDNVRVSRSGMTNGVESSRNWSGLIDTGTTFTAVAGHWTVPFVRASTAPKVVATWVGISGISHTTTLIQTGVDGITTSGTVRYFPWFELIPTPQVPINEPVSPGDQMSAVIKQTGVHTWYIGIEDVSKGVRGRFPVRSFGHEKSAPLAVMFNPT